MHYYRNNNQAFNSKSNQVNQKLIEKEPVCSSVYLRFAKYVVLNTLSCIRQKLFGKTY